LIEAEAKSYLSLMHRSRIVIGIGAAILVVVAFGLNVGTYPSPESAERFLRRAVDGEWDAFLLDGTPRAPRDVASIESADCKKDSHLQSDFPLFACVYRFKSTSPRRDFIGVVGAMYYRGDLLPTLDGYIVYPWAILDQRQILDARGITFPVSALPGNATGKAGEVVDQ
jgi:hypothetical protein